MIKQVFKCLVLLVLLNNYTYSQELVPPIQNYSPSEYMAASQNWDIALDEKGVVYAANNQGLLVFDGLSWELFPLESQSIIRSVLPHNGRIYTGSYQEFGYWERQADGQMQYTSLGHLMEDFNLQSDEFWEITAFKDAIYFRSFGAVFKYENGSISQVTNVVSTAMDKFQDRLIFAPRKRGLVYLTGRDQVKTLEGDLKAIDDINIRDIESHGDSLFIASKESLYFYHDQKVELVKNSELNELLKSSELNHIISVSKDEIILGTIKNGIVQYNLKQDKFKVYNHTSGLQNNTVLGMAFANNRLWLALDKGVDMVNLHAPLMFYSDNSGELGAVYDLQKFEDECYLASNTGVYNFKDGNLKLIENAGDHTWNLEEIDGVLYANHNTGIYRISDGDFIPIDTRTGSFSVKKISDISGDILISHYTGLSLYDIKKEELRELEEISFPIKEVVFENDQVIWAAHPYEGIYKISHTNFEDIKVEKIEALGEKENFNPRLYNLNNQVIAYVNGQWYQYNPFQNSFKPFEELNEFKDHRLINKGDDTYVFADADKGGLMITDLKDEVINLDSKELKHRLVKTNENFIRQNDSIFFVTLNDGFARINLDQLKRSKQDNWISTPFIKEFSDASQRYEVASSPVIPFKNSKNLTLKVGMPVSTATMLHYELSGEEYLSGYIETGTLNLRNLDHGDYHLVLTALGNGSEEAATTTLDFSIAAPWYLSLSMKLVYAFLILSTGFLIYWLNQQKLKKHQLQLEAKFEQEHAERLNRIEKERLMNEIDLKRKELANTTMMAAKKNEVLMEIQGELNKDKNKFSNQFRLKHIMTKINNAVKNKDEWKLFETNFNEVHEDFFKDLLARYPKLTSKDLKLCSYLKMNLSSKEIAPLMGISVRGVEVHRYRLRKKMELDSDVNLTKFLIKNF
ncbi:triple tyrosine motif-containing protein [Pontixanthobacter gangjinensis]|uniref:Histidine kinase n=1 Tax=Christiangramia aestuarii TaxID=1028746 RepID=A0A7K1LMI2_9FLAO|nr:LuxR C-terminal-related transcriptional regulator [Christiangramia aestuarii]MUP41948.1 histidine kinase [Christiangramia aestuarii]